MGCVSSSGERLVRDELLESETWYTPDTSGHFRTFPDIAIGLSLLQRGLQSSCRRLSTLRRAIKLQLHLSDDARPSPAFDRPAAEFQALRYRLSDMAVEVEAARRLTYAAVEAFTSGDDCVKEVSMAKLFSTEMANRVAYEAVQMHGGLGYMRELPVERFACDYRLWTIAAGSSEMVREIIAKKLLG